MGVDHRIWGPLYPGPVARHNGIKCVAFCESASVFAGVATAEGRVGVAPRADDDSRAIVHGGGGGDGDSEQIPSIACRCCAHGSGLSSSHSWTQARSSAQS